MCCGTKDVYQQGLEASLRDTSQDVDARKRGDSKEFERRQKSALALNNMSCKNQKTPSVISDQEAQVGKAASVRKDRSDCTKVRQYLLNKGEPKDSQED